MFKPLQAVFRRKTAMPNVSSASIALKALKGEDIYGDEPPRAAAAIPAGAVALMPAAPSASRKSPHTRKKAVRVVNGNRHSEDKTASREAKTEVQTEAVAPAQPRPAKPKRPATKSSKSGVAVTAEPRVRREVREDTASQECASLGAFKRFARGEKLSVAWDKSTQDFAQPHTQQMHKAWLGGAQHQTQDERSMLTKLQEELAKKDKEIAQQQKVIAQMTVSELKLDHSLDRDAVIANLTAATRRLSFALSKLHPDHALATSAHQYLERSGLLAR